jgi:hypothetical protein
MVPGSWYSKAYIVRRTRCASLAPWKYITRWFLSIDRLSKCVQSLQEHLFIHGLECGSSESETEYPITPPPLDSTAVFAVKNLNTRRHALTLCLVSRQSAKPAIASAAQSLAQAQAQIRNCRPRKANYSRTSDTFQLSVDQFDELLESKSSFVFEFCTLCLGLSRWGWSFITGLYDRATYKPWSFQILLYFGYRASWVLPMAY